MWNSLIFPTARRVVSSAAESETQAVRCLTPAYRRAAPGPASAAAATSAARPRRPYRCARLPPRPRGSPINTRGRLQVDGDVTLRRCSV